MQPTPASSKLKSCQTVVLQLHKGLPEITTLPSPPAETEKDASGNSSVRKVAIYEETFTQVGKEKEVLLQQ